MSDEPEKQEQSSEPNKKEETKDLVGIGKKIILAEDDPTSANLIEKLLSPLGYDVVLAINGKEALAKITPEFPPHVIISDVLMPEKDGFQFFKDLKDNESTKNIPVLITTGRKNMEDSFIALGADGFLAKPVNPEELIDLVGKLANRPAKKKDDAEKPDNKAGDKKE